MSIRSLGVPMGMELDVTEWWHTKYQEVKQRIALWPSLSRLSISGRNLLLQSILYGCLRYWFFSLILPQRIVDLIESDAKQLL